MSDIKEKLTEDIVKNFETHFTEQYNENDWRRLKGVRVQEPLSWLRHHIGETIDLAIAERDKEIVEMIKNSPKTCLEDTEGFDSYEEGYESCLSDIINLITNTK